MILTCPECSTRYKAKNDTIGPNGRTVRCAKCNATWFASTLEGTLSTPDELQLADMQSEREQGNTLKSLKPSGTLFGKPDTSSIDTETRGNSHELNISKGADAVMRDKADAAKQAARLRTILLIWLIPLTLIAIMGLSLFLARETIAERFPGTVPIYKSLRIKTSATGLEVDPPVIRIARVNGEQTIIINGVVKNMSSKTKPLPYLTLSLHNNTGDELANWRVEFAQDTLKRGERIEFLSEYPNPPLDLKRLRYRLEG